MKKPFPSVQLSLFKHNIITQHTCPCKDCLWTNRTIRGMMTEVAAPDHYLRALLLHLGCKTHCCLLITHHYMGCLSLTPRPFFVVSFCGKDKQTQCKDKAHCFYWISVFCHYYMLVNALSYLKEESAIYMCCIMIHTYFLKSYFKLNCSR